MQQMMSNPATSPFGQQPSATQPPPNPMQQMMQQVMSMRQQMMQQQPHVEGQGNVGGQPIGGLNPAPFSGGAGAGGLGASPGANPFQLMKVCACVPWLSTM